MPGILGRELLPPQSYRAPVGQGHDIHAIWEDAKGLGSLGGAGRALGAGRRWSSSWRFSLVGVGRRWRLICRMCLLHWLFVEVPAHQARCRQRTTGAELVCLGASVSPAGPWTLGCSAPGCEGLIRGAF